MTSLRIGTRGSALARWQAERVKQLLAARDVAAELVPIKTAGDRVGARRRTDLAVKGLFTKEIEDALSSGRVDAAVHSLKDLLVELPPQLMIAAVPEREDARDALVTRDGTSLEDLPPGAVVGTASARRRAAVLAQRPDLEVVALHGNVPTRIQRVEGGSVDAAVLAMAGLKRLGLTRHATPLDPSVFVPAAGQGALAVQVRATDDSARGLVAPLDDPDVRAGVDAERAVLAGLNVDCNVPVGATCLWEEEVLTLLVTVYAPDGATALTTRVPVNRSDPRSSGAAAAAELLGAGAGALIQAALETKAPGGSTA